MNAHERAMRRASDLTDAAEALRAALDALLRGGLTQADVTALAAKLRRVAA